ncbi:MAG TPA: MinD/ParA family protein [Tepidisphaeraceae bacterium]|jgi:MinD-like ATPase involved in chromosome partitioning or flagellar assembly|nr:MinD/ParA family protein [Tepidisphaeraceae bacterium]
MPKIISIHSFRGGTGKSNMTANIASSLALHGKRVGIVDTDIQSPGIHVLFGMDEENMTRALNDYLWGECLIEDTAYIVTPPPVKEAGGTIYLIPSSIKPGEIARVLREGYDVARLIDGIRQLVDRLKLDYLLIDTHPGLNEETLLSITISDALVVILRPDNQDYQGTAVTVELARQLEVPKMFLLVNKVPAAFDREQVREKVAKTYNAQVAGVIQLTDEVVRLASGGVFCLLYPDHPVAKQIRGIADLIVA